MIDLLFGVANVALEIESGNTESGVNDRFTLICFMAAGAGVGLGCGILWGAQGVYITEQVSVIIDFSFLNHRALV
eukprot:SAG31_NODE_805_length_11970_cov_3.710793_4_plen_75_part_00